MKPRTVIISMEIETDLPVKVLREACIRTFRTQPPAGRACYENIFPLNRPKIEVVNATKGKRT